MENRGARVPEVYSAGFVVLGGDPRACAAARRAYELRFARSAPVRRDVGRPRRTHKYMANAYLATKVSFVNQFYDIATQAGLDFDALRRLFLLDPRVGDSHTTVTRERGFGGKCLPKDLRAILAWTGRRTDTSLLRAVADYNDTIRAHAARGRASERVHARRPNAFARSPASGASNRLTRRRRAAISAAINA